MTGFSSTGVASTAMAPVSGFDAIISFIAPVINMVMSLGGVAGGAGIPAWLKTWTAEPEPLSAAAGAMAFVDQEPWAFAVQPFEALAGARTEVLSLLSDTPAIILHTGTTVELAMAMLAVSDLEALGGSLVAVSWAMEYSPLITVAIGATVLTSPAPWTFTVTDFTAAAGVHAGLYNDVQVMEFPGTAQFATARLLTTYSVVRTLVDLGMHAPIVAKSGALLDFDIPASAFELNEHGPVARPRGVLGQIILS